MGILSQQLIGSGSLQQRNPDPFPTPPESRVPKSGFGGFTYAPNVDPSLQLLFHSTPYNNRAGPIGLVGANTEYGRGSNIKAKTLLGQFGLTIAGASFGAQGSAQQIAYSLRSSRSLRSLKDATETVNPLNTSRPVYHASGGPFIGFDDAHPYAGSAGRGEPIRTTNTINTGLRAIDGIRGVPPVEENNDGDAPFTGMHTNVR